MKAQAIKLPVSAKFVAAMLLSAVGGGAVMAIVSSNSQVNYRQAGQMVAPIATAEATRVLSSPVEPVMARQQEDSSAPAIQLTDRERQVLARLASLPDLPVVQTPAFDVKVQNAPSAPAAPATAMLASAAAPAAKTAETPNVLSSGESVIARIQVVSVDKGRVFYRSVDDVMHTARAGERLLGVNGRVIAVDEQGAVLQIDGQRMRVAANNM